MKEESEYLKQIKESLWNISEDNACDILNAYYNQCERDDEPCTNKVGSYIYNLMDTKQAVSAVKHYGLANVAETFCKKSDWILVANVNVETNKPILETYAPSVVLDSCLRNIICSYCYDPMAYPTFFREALSEPLSKLCSIEL